MPLTALEEQQLTEVDVKSQCARREENNVQVAPLSLGSWHRCSELLESKKQQYVAKIADRRAQHEQQQEDINQTKEAIAHLQQQLHAQETKLTDLQEAEKTLSEELAHDDGRIQQIDNLKTECDSLGQVEKQRTEELAALLKEKPLRTLQPDQLALVWWRMDLPQFAQVAGDAGIDGEMMLEMEGRDWLELGLSGTELCRVQYMVPMLALPDGLSILEHPEDEDCTVCNAHTPGTTVNLLSERKINIPADRIKENGWITPYLIYESISKDKFGLANNEDYRATVLEMKKLRRAHEEHLAQLRNAN